MARTVAVVVSRAVPSCAAVRVVACAARGPAVAITSAVAFAVASLALDALPSSSGGGAAVASPATVGAALGSVVAVAARVVSARRATASSP